MFDAALVMNVIDSGGSCSLLDVVLIEVDNVE